MNDYRTENPRDHLSKKPGIPARRRFKFMARAVAAARRYAKRAEKLPYFQSATDAYMRGWMAGYRAHRNDVSPPDDRPPDGPGWSQTGPTQYVD